MATFNETTELENEVLEAGQVYLLMKKQYRISRNMRSAWFFSNLNRIVAPTPLHQLESGDGDLLVLSVLPKGWQPGDSPPCGPADDGGAGGDGVTPPCRLVASSHVIFLACRYRFVIALDLSPSTAVVDDWCGEIVFDRVFRTLALCLRRLARPFLVPGTRNLFRPEIFITVLAYSPFMASGSQQVLVQGCRLDLVHLPSFLHDVRVQLMRFEGHVAEFLQKQREPMMAQDDGDAPISPPPLPSSPTGPTPPAPSARPPTSAPPLGAGVERHLAEPVVMVTADVGLVSVLRYGVLALQLLPANTSSGIIVITDGVTSIPDINYCDMLLTQLRNSTVACSFLQVGGVFSYDCNFGHVPNVEMMRFIATATGGTYAGPEVFHDDIDDYGDEDDVNDAGGRECSQEGQGRRESSGCSVKEEVGALGDVLLHQHQQEVGGAGAKSGRRTTGSMAMTAYHKAFLTYSFMEAARGGGVGDVCGSEHRLFNEHLAWASANPALATRRKKHAEREVHAELGSIVSVRLREGYSVRDVALTKGGSQIEVKLVLPWKHNLRIEYCVSAPWPQHRSPPPSSPLLITTAAATSAHSLSHCSSTTTLSISSQTSSSSSAQASTSSSTTNALASHFVSTSTATSSSAVTSTTTSTVTSSSTCTSSSSAVAGHSNSTASSSLATTGGAGSPRGGSAVQPVCLTEVTMEGGYEVLHDITCTMRKPIASPYRMAVVRKFWQTLLGIAQTDQLLVHLQSFSSNPAFYTVPESTRNGVPLFYLPPGSSTPVLSLQQSGLGKDSSHGQFSGYWKPVFSLDVGKLQRWMHLHRIGVLLQHDVPVPRYIHTPNSNGRFATVQSRVAMSALTSLLRTWSSFVLVEANSYVKLVDLPNGSVTFYLVRISAKAPCVVLRLAFPLETPASTRNKVVDDLRRQIWQMSYPQRVLQQPQPQPQPEQPEGVEKGKSKTCLFTESPAASKSSQPPPASDRPCAVLLTKPVEKLLIRYERAPTDYLSPPAPAPPLPLMQLQQRQPPLLLAAAAAVPGSPCSALAHYFTHRRWVFSVEPLASSTSSNASSTTSPTSSYTAAVMAACTRLLQTLTELRLAEGFNFAASGDGVVSMVTELPMKAECEGKGDCDEVQTCLLQYVLFPPLSISPRHTFSTDEDGDDDGDDDCNDDILGSDGEVMLLVSCECWLEPLSGRVSIPPERYVQQSHLDGLCYTDIPHAMHPRDMDCVNTLLTSELLAFLCNNPDAHYAPNRAIQPLAQQESGASTLWHIPFRFDLMCLLPKCRQAEMVFNTYSTDPSWSESSTSGLTHPCDWLLSLFHGSLSEALALREIPLDEGDHVTFVKLVLDRDRDGRKPLFSMPAQQVETEKQETSISNGSKDTADTTSTAKGTGFARWRCYAKATGSGHTLVFVPASFADLQLLLRTNPDPVLKVSVPVVNTTQAEELVPLPANPHRDPDQVLKSPAGRPASQDRPYRSSHALTVSRQGSLIEPSPSSSGLRLPVYVYSHSLDSLRETLTRLPAPPCPASTPDATAAAAEAAEETSASSGGDMFFWCSSEEGGVDLSSRQHREKELMGVCELVQEVFHQSFMKGLFHCLRQSVAVAASDVLSAIDFCEETLTEVDITAFLQALCGHVRPRASCQSRHSSWEDDGGGDDGGDGDGEGDDVGDLHTCYCCCRREHQNLRGGPVLAEAVEMRENSEPGDGGGDASMDSPTVTVSVLPGSSPHTTASSLHFPHLTSPPLASHDDSYQPLPNLHSAIQAKFLEISGRFFKSIPSNPDFFFYCPTLPKKENETQGVKRKSRRFGKAEGVSEVEGNTEAQTSFSLTESDADIVVEYRDEHTTGGDATSSTWRQGSSKDPDDDDEEDDELEEEDDDGDEPKDDNGEVEFSSNGTIDAADRANDFEIDDDDDDDDDDSDGGGDAGGDEGGDFGDGLPPLFVHLTCSVSVLRKQHCSMPVRTLPTCLGEVLGWLEGVDLRTFSLKDLTVTLDIIILTLPLEIEESPLGISHNRYASENSAFIHRSPAQGSSYLSDEENVLHGPLLPSAIAELREGIPAPLANLTETHRQAILDTVEEVHWLLRDEVVSALRVARSVSRRSLSSVAAHVSRSRDRPSCLTEHVALQFVFGPDQSMSRFMRELESMDLGQKYELRRSGEFHFVAIRETQDMGPSLSADYGDTTSVEVPSATTSGGGDDATSVDGVAVDSEAVDGTDTIAAAVTVDDITVDSGSIEAAGDGSIVDNAAVDGAANDGTTATASDDTTTTVTTNVVIDGSSSNDVVTSPTPDVDVCIEDGAESAMKKEPPNSPEDEETISPRPAASDTGQECIVEFDTRKSQGGGPEDPLRCPPLMPDFWLILRVQQDRVTVFTHSRSLVVSSDSPAHTSPSSPSSSSSSSAASSVSSSSSLSDHEPEFLSVHRTVVKKIAEICRVVNQSLLLQDLHDTRCCNSLLVAESEEDIWKQDSVFSSYRQRQYVPEEYGADDGYQSKDYLAASMHFMPGHFACDIMWSTVIPVHPRLRMAPILAGSKGMQSLRSALAAFSVGNRKNMYVYQERSTGAVCYLRLIEESATVRTSFDSNKEWISSPVALHSPSITSPSMSLTRSQEPTASTEEPVTPRGWWDRQVSIESVSSRAAESSARTVGHSEKNIRLNVHGVVPAGVEVTGELLKALLRRLHEATLDVITVMLVRNCMLTPADVQFLQPPGQAPSETVLVSMPTLWGPRFPAVLHYLRQNLHTFLLSPKYIDTDPDNHFQHSPDKTYAKGEIYLYNKPGGLGTGGKGIACVALSMLAPPTDTSESSTEEAERDPLSDTDLDSMTQVTLVKQGSEVPTSAVFRFSLWETGTISIVQLCERLRAAVLHAVCEAALEFSVLTAPLSISEPTSSSSSSPTSSLLSSSPATALSCLSLSPAAAEVSTLTPLSSSAAPASTLSLSPSSTAAGVGASLSVASSTTQTSPLSPLSLTATPQATDADSALASDVPIALTSPAPATRSISNPISGGTRGSQPPLSPGMIAGISAMPEPSGTSGTPQGKPGRRSFWEILANKTDSPNAGSPKTTDDITSNSRDEVGAARRRRHKTGSGVQSDVAASPAGSGTTWLHQEIARRQEEEKRQHLEEGVAGVLHPAYMGPCQRWLEFMHNRGCPSVQRCEMELSSRLQVDRFLAETENLVHGAAEDTGVRVYIRDSGGTKWHPYQPFQEMSVTPGLQRKFVILARSIAQWRNSGVSSLAHKSLQRFEALDAIGAEKPSDQGGAVHSGKSGQTIAPRQRFLVFSVDDRKLSLHTYNWSSEMGASVMRGTSRLVHWLNARTHLLLCLLSQKMGLFHHYYYGDLPPPHSDPGKQMEPNPFLQPPCEADALIRSSAPPPPKDPTRAPPMGPGRGLLASGSTTAGSAGGGAVVSGGGVGGVAAAPASLELLQLDEALRDVVAPWPMRLAPYGASGDAVTRHGEQYREIRAHERREIEAQCKIESLFITWQQRSAQSNMPITVSELDLLRQSSRLVHYCATPLVFDPATHSPDATAASSVPPMVPHRSPPSGTSDMATLTPTAGTAPTTSTLSLTTGPAAASGFVSGGGGEAWLLELCTAFIQQYVQYLQSLGFILVQLRPATPARRSSVSTRPRSSAFSVNTGTSDGKPRSQRPWPESSTKAAGGVSSLMYHLQRALPGGLVLMELGFQRHFFTVKQFALECSRFPVGQSLNPQGFIGLKARMKHYVEGSTISESALSMLFTEECERVRDLMHVHSFSHDFHLRVAHHYLLGRQLTFPRAYALGAFLHRFARAHRSAPKYGRNHLLTGELELSVGGTPAPQLYAYMVEHAHTYGLKPLTMESGPGSCSPGGPALEFALVALSTRSGSYKDADGVRHFDDFDVSLIVRHDTSNLYNHYEHQQEQQQPEPQQQQQHSDLKLLYCLVMTSCRELFPRLTADMSRFRKLPRSYRPEQQQQQLQLKDQQQQKHDDAQQQHVKMKQLQQLQQEQQEQQEPQQFSQHLDTDDDHLQQQQEDAKEQQQQRSEACPLLLQQLLRRTDGAAETTVGPREQHTQRTSREPALALPSSTSPSSSSTSSTSSSSPPHPPLFPLLASEKESALARIRSVVALARSQCRRDSLWQRLLLAADSTSEAHAASAPMPSPSAATSSLAK